MLVFVEQRRLSGKGDYSRYCFCITPHDTIVR